MYNNSKIKLKKMFCCCNKILDKGWVDTCNPSYEGGADLEDHSLRSVQAKS
jgi:hypothetical protein